MSHKSSKIIGGIAMRFNKRLKESYNKQVSKPEDYQKVADSVEIKKTHHTLFKSLKITAIVTTSSVGALVLAFGGFVLISSLKTVENVKSIKKARFSVYDTNLVKSETFKSLNEIHYTEEKESDSIDTTFIKNVNAFASNSFSKVSTDKNVAYSPLMLYTQLDLISCAVSDDETKNQFDSVLLTSDIAMRENNIYRSMRNNFFVNKETKNTVQTKNAVFVDSDFGANPQFVDDLSRRNAEVYEMDFQTKEDVNKATEWINQSVNEPGFINADYLEVKEDSALLFLSSLYFDNSWSTKYKTHDTKKATFYITSDETTDVDFMNHAFYGKISEYDKYVSVTDQYSSGYSIQFFVPKNISDSVFELLPNDFLSVLDTEYKMISLSLPKMSLICESDLSQIVKDLGITNPYISHSNHLVNAFKDQDSVLYSYLNYTKQKTSLSFSEDGTVVKSVVISMGAAGKAAPGRSGYEIELNQPFVYCIRDISGLPLVLGSVLNPNK